MLENAWLIPLVPVVSFFLILFFGKRLPSKGSVIGVASLAICLAMSLALAAEWLARDATVETLHHATAEQFKEHLDAEGDHSTDGATHGETSTHGRTAAEEEHSTTSEEGEHGEAAEEEEEHVFKRAPVVKEKVWFQSGGIKINFGVLIDGLSIALLVVVSTISLLVHIFSTEYMRDDRRKTHYFAALSLFTSGMFILVTASNTLQMIFGWELMGLCSFMLIGHWWEDKDNSNAALKAFFTTRTGDIGLLVGVSMLFGLSHSSFDIGVINDLALSGQLDQGLLTVAASALLLAVIGKSAQFPLHTWLPDAMAGPTPVSALIHAATMVVAGVFLIARLYGVFWQGFNIGAGDGYTPVALVGAMTIVIAALLAFVQRDIKKVLAYSTVSQLGYMVMALGVGAWTAAVFHLFTHAFFKACLFLGAGSVAHSGSHHSFDMEADMGGLKKHMPITYWTFVVATAALAGFPLTAGFFSKDEILVGASENGYKLFLWVGVVGAGMTAAYMTRCVYKTFHGEARGNAAHHHPHESPLPITGPLVFLAILSVLSGYAMAPMLGIEWFADVVEPAYVSNVVSHHGFIASLAIIGTLAGVIGFGSSYLYYFRNLGPRGVVARNGMARGGYNFLVNKYYLDRLYTDGVVGGLKGPIARATYWVNQNIIDGVLNGTAAIAIRLGRFTYEVVDQQVVDGAVNGIGVSAEAGGGALRTVQTGKVQQYAAFLFGALIVFAIALWQLT
ncbi:MAG: NADH-quinone oxidoreductase subunit L [Acidimicrobiales bacterium]|nr:NADH-quinone oxidoreductase subunit L [Acidimicrobiales bacterium]